jgi:hypothetical protein
MTHALGASFWLASGVSAFSSPCAICGYTSHICCARRWQDSASSTSSTPTTPTTPPRWRCNCWRAPSATCYPWLLWLLAVFEEHWVNILEGLRKKEHIRVRLLHKKSDNDAGVTW